MIFSDPYYPQMGQSQKTSLCHICAETSSDLSDPGPLFSNLTPSSSSMQPFYVTPVAPFLGPSMQPLYVTPSGPPLSVTPSWAPLCNPSMWPLYVAPLCNPSMWHLAPWTYAVIKDSSLITLITLSTLITLMTSPPPPHRTRFINPYGLNYLSLSACV